MLQKLDLYLPEQLPSFLDEMFESTVEPANEWNMDIDDDTDGFIHAAAAAAAAEFPLPHGCIPAVISAAAAAGEFKYASLAAESAEKQCPADPWW